MVRACMRRGAAKEMFEDPVKRRLTEVKGLQINAN